MDTRLQLEGVVVHGDKRGRELSYPTANIDLQNQHKIVPKQGVYLVKSKLKPCNLWHDEYRNKTYF